jgi:hypothetical protein
MLPNVIDFEASGFGYDSYPIEVGLALATGERFCTLITPAADWQHWDPSAEQLHHIKQSDLHAHGLSVKDVCLRLNHFLADQTVYSDAWVVDKPWLIKLFAAADLQPAFTLSPIESIQTEAQQQLWADVKQELLVKLAFRRHRASNDALLIQETYKATRQLLVPPLV